MTQIFRAKNRRNYVATLILDIGLLLIIAGFVFWAFGLRGSIDWFVMSVKHYWYIFIILGLWAIAVVIIYIRGLSYKITLIRDGSLVESEVFSKSRTLNVKDISRIGRQQYTKDKSHLSLFLWGSRIQTKLGKNMGPLFLNKIYSDFPRHAVDENIINAIQNERPGIPADQQSEYKI